MAEQMSQALPSGTPPMPQFPPGYLDEYNGGQVVSVCVAFIVLQFVFVSLRFYSRRIMGQLWDWDDLFVGIATIFCFAVDICSLLDVYVGGIGHHIAAIATYHPEKMLIWTKYMFVLPLLYYPAVAFPKLSILYLYLKIFTKKRDRVICWAIAGIVVANFITTVVGGFLACRPLEYWWNRSINGHCVNVDAFWRWPSLVNVLTDIVMLVLPMPMLYNLQTSVKVKIGLGVAFAAGAIGFIAALVRFVRFFLEDYQTDSTWTACKLLVVTVLECGTYLIASCLLSLKPLLRLWHEKVATSWSYGRSNATTQPKSGSYKMAGISIKTSQKGQFTEIDETALVEEGRGGHHDRL